MVTSTRALAEILRQISEGGESPLAPRWEAILDAQFGSVDFVIRHAAVVELFQSTARAVMSELPSAGNRTRLAQLHSWWSAVIAPDALWRSGGQSPPIDGHALNYLELAAEKFDDLDESTEPDQTVLDDLLEQVKEWLGVIEAEVSLSRGLRGSLIQHLDTLAWAISQADRFGTALIVPAADRTTGAIMRASMTPSRWDDWTRRLVRFAGAVALLSGTADQAFTAIEHGVTVVGELVPGGAQAESTDPESRDGSSSG